MMFSSLIFFRIPLFAARIVLGAFAKSLVTGQNTNSDRIKSAGYQFQFEDIEIALYHLYIQTS